MKYISYQLTEIRNFLLDLFNECPTIIWISFFTILISLSIIIAMRIKYSHWDGGIDKKNQKDLQVYCPFDSSKGILYISRRMVGFWEDASNIHLLSTHNRKIAMLNSLASRYNLILYIPQKDQFGVEVYNIRPSIEFIMNNGFPICYITQHMPPRYKVRPFSCNDDNLWFVEYKKGDEVSRWEGYS